MGIKAPAKRTETIPDTPLELMIDQLLCEVASVTLIEGSKVRDMLLDLRNLCSEEGNS